MDLGNQASFKECVIQSEYAQTSIPHDAVATELTRCGYGEDAVFAIKLALEEALINAVKHGNDCDKSKTVTIRYDVNECRAVIIVRDQGAGFDIDNVPDPTAPDRLAIPSGRGVMLIRAYMDEVEYRDQGREVCFIKRRRCSSQERAR